MSIMPNIRSASTYLLRFDEPQQNLPSIVQSDVVLEDVERTPETNEEFEVDDIAAMREEYNRLLQVYQEQQQNIDILLTNARNEWISNEGKLLADKLTSALQSAFDALREDVMRVLAPTLGEKIVQMSVSDLIAALQHATTDAEKPFLRIEGPKYLIDVFSDSIGDNISFEVHERDEIEIMASHHSTCITTRIRDWGATIQDMMENC